MNYINHFCGILVFNEKTNVKFEMLEYNNLDVQTC